MELFSKIVLVAFLATAWDPNAPVAVPHGFLTGSGYLQLPDAARHGYGMGLLDGIFLSPILGADGEGVQRLKDCTLPMNSEQITAIFEKYLRDNPEIWHYDAQILFWQALLRACPQVVPR